MANPRKSGGKRTVCLSVCSLSIIVVVLLILVIYFAAKPHPCDKGMSTRNFDLTLKPEKTKIVEFANSIDLDEAAL